MHALPSASASASTSASTLLSLLPATGTMSPPGASGAPSASGSFSQALVDARAHAPLDAPAPQAAVHMAPPAPPERKAAPRPAPVANGGPGQGSAAAQAPSGRREEPQGDPEGAASEPSVGTPARAAVKRSTAQGPQAMRSRPLNTQPAMRGARSQDPPSGTGLTDPQADGKAKAGLRDALAEKAAGEASTASSLALNALVLGRLHEEPPAAGQGTGGDPTLAAGQGQPFELQPSAQAPGLPGSVGNLPELPGSAALAETGTPATALQGLTGMSGMGGMGGMTGMTGFGDPIVTAGRLAGLEAAAGAAGAPPDDATGDPAAMGDDAGRLRVGATASKSAAITTQLPAALAEAAVGSPGPDANRRDEGLSSAADGAAAPTSLSAPALDPPVAPSAPPAQPAGMGAMTGSPSPSAANGAQPARDVPIAAPFGSEAFTQQVGQQISLLAIDGVQHARLHLHPAEMGPITVQIAVDNGQAQVTLVASQADTRELLEQAMPVLASNLRESGLTLSGGGVFEQPRPRDGRADTGDGPGSRPSTGEPGADEALATQAPIARARTLRGVVDVYA